MSYPLVAEAALLSGPKCLHRYAPYMMYVHSFTIWISVCNNANEFTESTYNICCHVRFIFSFFSSSLFLSCGFCFVHSLYLYASVNFFFFFCLFVHFIYQTRDQCIFVSLSNWFLLHLCCIYCNQFESVTYGFWN